MGSLLESLLWGGAAASIAAISERSIEEVLAAGASGVVAGAFVAAAGGPSGPQAKCLTEALEYLVVTGEAESVDVRDDRVAIKIPSGATPKAVEAVLRRCNPESVDTSKFGDTVIARF